MPVSISSTSSPLTTAWTWGLLLPTVFCLPPFSWLHLLSFLKGTFLVLFHILLICSYNFLSLICYTHLLLCSCYVLLKWLILIFVVEKTKVNEEKQQREWHVLFLFVDDWQEEEDKDELENTVSVIFLRLIWVSVVF